MKTLFRGFNIVRWLYHRLFQSSFFRKSLTAYSRASTWIHALPHNLMQSFKIGFGKQDGYKLHSTLVSKRFFNSKFANLDRRILWRRNCGCGKLWRFKGWV